MDNQNEKSNKKQSVKKHKKEKHFVTDKTNKSKKKNKFDQIDKIEKGDKKLSADKKEKGNKNQSGDNEEMLNKKNLKKKEEILIGIFSKHRKGFGFVIPEQEGQNDIFIPPSYVKGAMNGDKVAVTLFPQEETEKKREGFISIILERAIKEVVGTLEVQEKFGFVIPGDKKIGEDIFIHKRNMRGARDGDNVVVTLFRWPEKGNSAEGKITEIISRKGEKGGDIKSLIRQFGLNPQFPLKVREEAAEIPETISEEEIINRRDLRNKIVFTIDGEDSKDFDDAVSIEVLKNGNYLLGVHIADVSHYVRHQSKLDKEALKRGNSVYLIDQVIPMLPEVLSNGICSLNPKVDRLTLSVDMEIDKGGNLCDHEIYESIICSTERLVYTDISDILEKEDPVLIEKYQHIYPDLQRMNELAGILRETREKRGSLDFDIDEAHITLNKKGIPTSIVTAERRTANKLIEEFMLKANETVAEHFFWLEAPFIYRIHEKPDMEKMEEFKTFLGSFGLNLKGKTDNVHPKTLGEIIYNIQGRPEESIINSVMLRSMKKAFYSADCGGHFGLALTYYSHFTSPIRRYPDLIVHRIIKTFLREKPDKDSIKSLKKQVLEASEICSKTERFALELEREVEKLKKAEYMWYHVGESYQGIISGVMQFGFFVALENTIEGMVPVDALGDDYYEYEAAKYRLMGQRTRKTYRLGDPVKIQVDSVDIYNREINFR